MKRIVLTGTVVCLCISLGAGSALAQEDSTNFIFAEYYVCDPSREGFADLLMEHVFGPVYDKYVEAGDLNNWGWATHNAGGRWRRLGFYTADSLETLLETRAEMIQEFEALEDQGREFDTICPEHDDLIWSSVAGPPPSAGPPAGPGPSYSTYYICDVTRQERADEIVRELLAPEINKLVESGELTGWGWSAHVIGGRFRRLMRHSGASHAGLIAAVNKYNQAASEKNEAMADEFSEICNSHVDYLWDGLLPKADDNN